MGFYRVFIANVYVLIGDKPSTSLGLKPMQGKQYFFNLKNQSMMKQFVLAACMLLITTLVLGQKLVTGLVTDAKGNPIAGATVSVKSTTASTTTDVEGKYNILVPTGGKVLVFSNADMGSEEKAIGTLDVINVRLEGQDKAMQEVVVVGYGTTRKRDVTGAVSSVNGSKIKDLPVQSFDQALSGRMAGVNVSLPNGVVNNPPVIRVRGINSINLSSFPLVVVDGVPSFTGNFGGTASNNPLGDINPSDIESVDVLKDAAATAIYGSRASAGVLLVTTKKGKKGKTRVAVDQWFGWTKAFNLIDMLDATEYTNIKNEALANAGTPADPLAGRGFFTINDANGNLVNTNWYDNIYRTGTSNNTNLSISGANDKTNYFISAGSTRQDGMIRNNDFKRLSIRSNVDHKVNNWLTTGLNLNYTNSINRAPNTGSLPGQAFGIAGLGRLPLVLAPNVGAYNNDGTYNVNRSANTIGQGNNLTALAFYNPEFILNENKFSSSSDRIFANAYFNIEVLKGLNFKTLGGIDYATGTNDEYRSAFHGDGVQFDGAAQKAAYYYRRWNLQNLLTYDKSFKDHTINILAGNEQQYTTIESFGADRRFQADPSYNEFQGGYNIIVPAANFLTENYLVSFFGRINYDYKKKYFLSVNARRDGFSAFAPGNKYGNFAGVSAGWSLSEEEWYKNSKLAKTLSNFKIRASTGRVGNNSGLGDFGFFSLFGPNLYGPSAVSVFSQAGNPDLTWETSNKTDVGFDLGFLDNRFTLEATIFRADVNNLILSEPQAPSRGIPGNTILNNVGSMRNTGLELAIGGSVLRKKDFTWNSSFNITWVRNEVTALSAGNADIFPATSGLERPNIIRVGESLGSFYAVRNPSQSVNPANGQRLFLNRNGQTVQYNHAAAAGQRWTLLDGTVHPTLDVSVDGVVVGPAIPKYTGGWDNTFKYKGFDLNVLLFFSGGNYIYNGTKAGIRDNRNWNSSKEVLNRWTKPGDVTNIPRVVFTDNVSNGSAIIMTENIEKGDFIKVRNIAFGYTIPKKILDKIHISNARAYFSAQNAFTFTKYTGFDPEVSANGNSNGSPSVDRNSVPQARSFTLGINVSF
jgi:TonB-dependent starch-binding outer membrane protein SusC